MSLFVDVSITAQSIVDAAWARATANRERLRRRLDVQAVREEAARNTINGRSGGLGWELQYTTPTPLQYRPDEPVAYPGRRQSQEQPDVFWLLEPFDASFQAITQGISPFTFETGLSGGGGGGPTFLPTSGPAGASACSGGEGIGFTTVTFTAEPIPISQEPASKAVTVEAMIKAYVPSPDASAPFMEVFIDFFFASLFFSRDWYDTTGGAAMPDQPLARVELVSLFGEGAVMAYSRDRPSGALLPEEGGFSPLPGAILAPDLEADVYHHLAVVQTPGDTPATRNVSFYLDGIRLATQTGLTPDAGVWPPFARISMSYGNRVDPPVISSSGLVHGVRFTPYALYTGDTYTPPTSITSLAPPP